MAASYKPTHISKSSKAFEDLTPEKLYWKAFDAPIYAKESGAVSCIHFSPIQPYNFAVTNSLKVSIYSSSSNNVLHTVTRFKDTAYGGCYRADGKILAAGGAEGVVKLFDVANVKSLLRVFKGHTDAVRVVKFMPLSTQVASFSDDKTIRCYDIPTEKEIVRLTGHDDYIRAGAVCQSSPDIILSGSYDHKVKMYDTRTRECIMTVDHGMPVESVLFFPTGSIFLSAGGNAVHVWDAFNKKLLAKLVNHHKTVTCMCLASNQQRLLTGSLDRLVKVYDISNYKVVHTLNYSTAVLSMGISADDKILAVGLADGLVSIQHRRTPTNVTEQQRKRKAARKRSYQNISKANAQLPNYNEESVVKYQSKDMLYKYDKHLKRFQSTKALDSVLSSFEYHKKPEVAVSVMQELIRRDGIKQALAGRDFASLKPLINFIIRYITNPAFMPTIIDVASALLDVSRLTICEDPDVRGLFQRLQKAVTEEVTFMEKIPELLGAVDCIFAIAESSDVDNNSLAARIDDKSIGDNSSKDDKDDKS